MALRDQPYLPLYVQDVLTDEKLIECSAEAHGIYFRLLCLLHKQEKYGVIELKSKYKQNENKIAAFSEMLRKPMPFSETEIMKSLEELITEGVITLDGDTLYQKRMKKDGEISEKRATAGSVGGKKGRNSGTKRYYNEPGFLYLIYDKDDPNAFKVGISAEPEKRIKGISRKTGRQNLAFRRKWSVNDMGETEQNVLDFFDEIRDGEWIFGEYSIQDIETQIDKIILKQKQNKSKIKANTEYENEYEYEYENEIDIDKKKEESEEKKDLPARTKKPTYASLFDKVLKEENLQLPEGFYELILEWLKYKSEKGQTYKETGLKNLIIKLMNDSGGNYDAAKNMIFYSVSNNYAGLFKEKANGRTEKTIAPATDIEIADILLKHFGDE